MLCLSDRKNVPSLSEFIIHSQKQYQEATGELTQIMSAIELASKVISREINKAGLVDIFGNAGSSNTHGEDQQKLDVIANEIFSSCLAARGNVCGIASEEDESFVVFPSIDNLKSKYVVVFDPVDGSSNINVGIPVGTIFSIYKRTSTMEEVPTEQDFLQAGNNQVAAGYILYGSSTVLVYTCGDGVNSFTLDPATGEYFLSRENIKIPETGKIYSVNDAYFDEYSPGIQKFISSMRAQKSSSRYVGSLVADFHRNLMQGGVFLYPANTKNKNGKLRLVYECNPLAFIVEQAGGEASDGNKRIMDLKPELLHQRTPLFIGSSSMLDSLQGAVNSAVNFEQEKTLID